MSKRNEYYTHTWSLEFENVSSDKDFYKKIHKNVRIRKNVHT